MRLITCLLVLFLSACGSTPDNWRPADKQQLGGFMKYTSGPDRFCKAYATGIKKECVDNQFKFAGKVLDWANGNEVANCMPWRVGEDASMSCSKMANGKLLMRCHHMHRFADVDSYDFEKVHGCILD